MTDTITITEDGGPQPVDIPGLAPDETGYCLSETHAKVRVTRPRDPAAAMYGYLAIAAACDADGAPVLRPSGRPVYAEYTRACGKDMLLRDPAGVADEMRAAAIAGALQALQVELAVMAANDQAGV